MTPDTKPQACPKCGAVAKSLCYFVSCSNDHCTFTRIGLTLSDWNRLRYVSEQEIERKQAAPKVRRMQANPAITKGYHSREHNENENCAPDGCQPVEATPEKPRRMQACEERHHGAECDTCDHFFEHDENEDCHEVRCARTNYSCQPVEAEQPAAPCARYDVSCPVADNCNGHDAACGQYRRRVEPQARGWEDYELFDDGPLLAFKDRSGETWYTYQAMALRGFMGFRYEYPNGEYDLFPEPCRKGGEDMDCNMWFPAAVRFAVERK